ncbi:hypothetical protein lbkm_2429 [Lachnospiraceae bacterium KM106-2]|nr:hypothetical protein lbkm_2429 [Lachnospiraceae bacterium KM106-2]
MYIDLNIIYVIIGVLGCVALGYLIMTLNNFNKLFKNVNELVAENKSALHESINGMPKVVRNCDEISEKLKDVTEVVTDVTADFIVTKESVKSNFEVITDIFQIIKIVLGK